MQTRISRTEARQRRAGVLFALAILALLSLVFAVSVGGIFIPVQLVMDVLLFGYVYLLAQRATLARERAAKVRQIRPSYVDQGMAFADSYDGYDDAAGSYGSNAYGPMRRSVGY